MILALLPIGLCGYVTTRWSRCRMSDPLDQTTPPDWWSEEGERAEAGKQAAELRTFLLEARLLEARSRDTIELAMLDLEAHANKRHE